ncbi:hypothetical protein GCM10023176_16480 [Micromonospora coerulea]|uniref:Uncharacterized protein n=1 Tax=Micromonospora coerulea TaxID=47856 RepID=A0ABP8SDU1_9ACTN
MSLRIRAMYGERGTPAPYRPVSWWRRTMVPANGAIQVTGGDPRRDGTPHQPVGRRGRGPGQGRASAEG